MSERGEAMLIAGNSHCCVKSLMSALTHRHGQFNNSLLLFLFLHDDDTEHRVNVSIIKVLCCNHARIRKTVSNSWCYRNRFNLEFTSHNSSSSNPVVSQNSSCPSEIACGQQSPSGLVCEVWVPFTSKSREPKTYCECLVLRAQVCGC